MAKYITQSNFNVFWAGLKTKLRAKVDVRAGYSLTKNDLTDALKAQYDAAYTNRVTGVTVNGVVDAEKATLTTAQDGSTRVLNIVMPTALQDLTNQNGDDKFATEKFVTDSYYTSTQIDNKLGTLTAGKTVAEMIADAATGKLTIELVEATYTTVGTPEGNPSENGYYEYNSTNEVYELSEDTTVDSGKTYYTASYVLPTGQDIENDKIYFVPKNPADGANNVYDEYVSVEKDGTTVLEKIGDTSVDLSGFQTTSAFNTWKTTDYDVFKNSIEAVPDADIQAILADDTSEGATDTPASGE